MSGKLLGIATKPATRAPMVLADTADISPDRGIEGDYRGQMNDRQITVLFEKDWDTVRLISGGTLPWERRRANLLVGGIDNPKSAGGTLIIGEVSLLVTGETKPCSRMDQAFPGLKMLLIPDWRGGVTCRVLSGGQIRIGERVAFSNTPG